MGWCFLILQRNMIEVVKEKEEKSPIAQTGDAVGQRIDSVVVDMQLTDEEIRVDEGVTMTETGLETGDGVHLADEAEVLTGVGVRNDDLLEIGRHIIGTGLGKGRDVVETGLGRRRDVDDEVIELL